MLKIMDSKTALGVTFMRALANRSSKINIFNDPYAEEFLPYLMRRPIKRKSFIKRAEWFLRRNRIGHSVLIRARYAEDKLQECINNGVNQYIILGAGWDSFAFRKPELLNDMHVFELDFPSTQKRKKNKLEKLGLTLHKNVHLIPIDFETTSISEALSNSDFDPNLPTFVTWQGVTYYLTMDAIEHVFDDLGDFCQADLDIVLDYIDDRFFHEWKNSRRTRRIHRAVSFIGEPFKSGFNPKTLANWLEKRNFNLVDDLNMKHQNKYIEDDKLNNYKSTGGMHVAHIKYSQ